MKTNKYINLLSGVILILSACTSNTSGINNPTPGTSGSSSVNTATGSSVPVITGDLNEKEPNDDFPSAMKVSLNAITTFNYLIGDKDRADFYEINIPAGSQDGILKVTVNELNNTWTPVLILYNSEKNDLSNFTTDNATNPLVWENPVSTGKKYFLKIEGETDIKTNYSLTLQFIPVPDPFEPNNSFAEAKNLILKKIVDIYLFSGPDSHPDNSNNDEDYFKFDIPEGAKIIRVKIENKSSSQAAQNFGVELFDPNQTSFGNILGDNEQANILTDFEIESSGVYYLKITASNSTVASKLTVTSE